MIEQYLPQTNESATVPKIQNFRQLNKALTNHYWFNIHDESYIHYP